MLNKLAVFVITILVLVTSSCTTQVEPTIIQTISPVSASKTDQPILGTNIPTYTNTPESNQPIVFRERFVQLNMLDDQNGTAILMNGEGSKTFAYTKDAGYNWKVIMPALDGYILSANFSNPKVGFLTSQNLDGITTLWSTSDWGNTWKGLELFENMMGASILLSENDYVLARIEDVAAGSAYIRYYESTDSGENWSLLPLLPPQSEEGLPEGIVRICNICGDLAAQTELNSLLVYGEMANEAGATISFDVSNDRGINWNRVELQKPQGFESAFVQPLNVNFGTTIWTIAISLVQFDPAFSSQIFVLHSQDNGQTWEFFDPALAIPSIVTGNIVQIDDGSLALNCGADICILNMISLEVNVLSLGQVWESSENEDSILLEFSDSQNAWLAVNSSETTILYHTKDGGSSWDSIDPILAGIQP